MNGFSGQLPLNATSKRWHLWEIDLRFALNSGNQLSLLLWVSLSLSLSLTPLFLSGDGEEGTAAPSVRPFGPCSSVQSRTCAPRSTESVHLAAIRASSLSTTNRSIIEMNWWTGLAPWELEFSFPGSPISTFRCNLQATSINISQHCRDQDTHMSQVSD